MWLRPWWFIYSDAFLSTCKMSDRKWTMKSASLRKTLFGGPERNRWAVTQDTRCCDAGGHSSAREKRTRCWAQQASRPECTAETPNRVPRSLRVGGIQVKGEGGDPAHWGRMKSSSLCLNYTRTTRKGQRKCWKDGWKVGLLRLLPLGQVGITAGGTEYWGKK